MLRRTDILTSRVLPAYYIENGTGGMLNSREPAPAPWTRRCLMDLFDKSRQDMEAEVKKSVKWVVLTAIVGLVLLTFYVMVT
jgi:hypothetical protein